MKVLVVEDSARLQRALAAGLRQAGYVVDVTGDGTEGLWLAQSNDYDVIVLDLMLPGLDGLSLLRKLRKEERPAHVLLLTARSAVEERIEGLRAGADDYLTKPFAFDELLARVEALVRRKHQRKNPLIQIGSLEVNTTARTVARSGQFIMLTPREYRLLEFLSLRAGEVVSRSDIEEHIYSGETEVFSNVVDSTISTLRKKLHEPGLSPLIHTRRGLGYVLGKSGE